MNSKYEKDFIKNIGGLILFCGGGIVYFLLKTDFDSNKLIDEKTKIIFESKKKVFFYFLGSLMFVILGGIFIFYSDQFNGRKMNPQIALLIGVICVIFFGLILFGSLIRLINSKRRLIEVTSSTLEIQTGFLKDKIIIIPKNEINSICEQQISSNKFIVIDVKNPEKYITKGFLKSKNYKLTGTPININPNITNFSSDEILKFLKKNINIEN